MYEDISPAYITDLVGKIESKISNRYGDYQTAFVYFDRWRKDKNISFQIYYYDDSERVNIVLTLNCLDNELILKIALDLGLEVPGLIYSIPEIKNIFIKKYPDIKKEFEEAVKEVFDDPQHAISLANSTLEMIIKKICEDDRIENAPPKKSLYDLTQHILKQFNYFPDKKLKELDQDIRNIGSSFLTISQAILNIRSKYTKAHGKTGKDYIIEDSLYAAMIVNSVTTVGLFLLEFYEKKYNPNPYIDDLDDDVPF